MEYMVERIRRKRTIEDIFGPLSNEVVEKCAGRKIVNIVDSDGVCRTQEITWYPREEQSDELCAIRDRIVTAGEIESMIRDFPTASEQTPLTDILQKMQASGSKAIPIMNGADLKGLITLEQIGRYNMLCSGYSCEFMGTSKA